MQPSVICRLKHQSLLLQLKSRNEQSHHSQRNIRLSSQDELQIEIIEDIHNLQAVLLESFGAYPARSAADCPSCSEKGLNEIFCRCL